MLLHGQNGQRWLQLPSPKRCFQLPRLTSSKQVLPFQHREPHIPLPVDEVHVELLHCNHPVCTSQTGGGAAAVAAVMIALTVIVAVPAAAPLPPSSSSSFL